MLLSCDKTANICVKTFHRTKVSVRMKL